MASNSTQIKRIFIVGILTFISIYVDAQQFKNSDLDGSIDSAQSALPYHWQSVPWDDTLCQADSYLHATPDLTDTIERYAIGQFIHGEPYSGAMFISGGHAAVTHSVIYHEGIMQTVSGFKPGCTYSVNFWQSVLKQTATRDKYGSWKIAIDNKSVGKTNKSFSDYEPIEKKLDWDFRSTDFIAKKKSHTIKLLPHDLDSVLLWPNGVTMGIAFFYYLIIGCH
jgi:hypothetical protein